LASTTLTKEQIQEWVEEFGQQHSLRRRKWVGFDKNQQDNIITRYWIDSKYREVLTVVLE
jgi:hypothetical protein